MISHAPGKRSAARTSTRPPPDKSTCRMQARAGSGASIPVICSFVQLQPRTRVSRRDSSDQKPPAGPSAPSGRHKYSSGAKAIANSTLAALKAARSSNAPISRIVWPGSVGGRCRFRDAVSRRRSRDHNRDHHPEVDLAAVQVASFTSDLLSDFVVSCLHGMVALIDAPQPSVRHCQAEDNDR